MLIRTLTAAAVLLLATTAVADPIPTDSSFDDTSATCDAAPVADSTGEDAANSDTYIAQSSCLSHAECPSGAACVEPGVCRAGAMAQMITFADINASPYFAYTDGSCNYDTDCGPWACMAGWCTTPEAAGRPIYPRANYTYYDTSCGAPTDCGALQCIDGWCRSAQFANAWNGTGQPPVPGGQIPTQLPPTNGMTAYTGTGYQLSCPSSWALSPPDGTTDIMCMDQIQDGFFENCNIVFENTGVPYDVGSYWNASRTMMQSMMAGFSVNNERPTTISGRSGYRVDYNHAMFGTPMRVIAYFLTNNTMGYVLTCTANHTSFATYEGVFDGVANSWVLY